MSVSTETVKRVAEAIYHELGIVVDSSNMRILASKLNTFMLRKRLSEQELIAKLRDHRFFEELVSVITVNETYFFREREHIDFVVRLLKKLAMPRVRILSIPCSTGEEPLSILMALMESGVNTSGIDIVGVDVDKKAIEMARFGIYSGRTVSKVPKTMLDKYFEPVDGAYRIKDELKRKIVYKVGNIFDVGFLRSLGVFDYIFCRNLLIYFDRRKREEALNNLAQIHKMGGYLFISKTETLIGLSVPYMRKFVDGIIVYARV